MMEPENTNENAVPDEENFAQNEPVEEFQDEPLADTTSNSKGATNSKGDPMKWNPTPTTIKILIVLNLIVFGVVGYIIWYAVDKERRNKPDSPTPARTIITPAPTMSPTKTTAPSASPSSAPSASPSVYPSAAPSRIPSATPSSVPSVVPSLLPSFAPSPIPTAIVSESPTRGEYLCFLCGEGKEITVTTGEVAFGDRITRTCAELQTDADNGDIVEEQCEALYDLVVDPCACRSTETLATRTTDSVRELFGTIVGTAIDFEETNEDKAADFIFNDDSYYSAVVDFATDDELIQRYLIVLTYFQTNIDAGLSAVAAKSECEWDGITCTFGQIVAVNSTGLGMNGDFPGDLFALPSVESIDLSNNPFSGSLPAEIGQASLLTALDLSSNQLSGNLPEELYDLTQLTSLDLSDNQFSGPVDSEITRLSKLDSLILTTNLLTGDLPTCDASSQPATVQADCSEVTCSCCNNCS